MMTTPALICLRGCRLASGAGLIQVADGQGAICPDCGGAIAIAPLAPDGDIRAAARRRYNTRLATAIGAAIVSSCAIISIIIMWD
jgi:hypothetical protein